MTFNDRVIYGLSIPGAPTRTPDCVASESEVSGSSAKVQELQACVTYNGGKTGAGVKPGDCVVDGDKRYNPKDPANRGAAGQRGMICLADQGKDALNILRFFLRRRHRGQAARRPVRRRRRDPRGEPGRGQAGPSPKGGRGRRVDGGRRRRAGERAGPKTGPGRRRRRGPVHAGELERRARAVDRRRAARHGGSVRERDPARGLGRGAGARPAACAGRVERDRLPSHRHPAGLQRRGRGAPPPEDPPRELGP